MEKEELRRSEEHREVIANLAGNPRVFSSMMKAYEEQNVEELPGIV